MPIFSVQIDKLNEAADKYSRVIQEVDTQGRNYNALIQEIDNSWDGLASVAYIRRMRAETAKLQHLRKYTVALRKYCKDTAEKMEAIDKMLQQIMSFFSSVWGGNSSGSNSHGGGGTQIPGNTYTVQNDPSIFGAGGCYQNEIDKIYSEMKNNGSVTWNYANSQGIGSISCQWFARAKLCERGFATDTGDFFSLATPAYQIPCTNGQNFTGAIAGIENQVRANGGEPIYNILIQGNNSGHTALIDKAYIDSSGQLKLLFSDNADWRKPIMHVANNGNGGTAIYQLMDQKEYTVSELSSVWNMGNYVSHVSVFGSPRK